MVTDLYSYILPFWGEDTGFFFGPLLASVIPILLWTSLFFYEIPIDYKIFTTTLDEFNGKPSRWSSPN
jgi:hypothetical protein